MTSLYASATNTEDQGLASYVAGGAIPIGSLCKYDTTEGAVVVCSAITDFVVGVATGTYASGDICVLQTRGVAKVIAGASISLGGQVMPKGSATAGTADAAGGATAQSCGIAEQDAASGGLFKMRIVQGLKGPPNA